MAYQYVKNPDGTNSETIIKRLSDGAFIPMEKGNRDFGEYEAWVEAGNTPADPE